MRNGYKSNLQGVGGMVESLYLAEEVFKCIDEYGHMCGEENCFFYDENGGKMTKDEFLTHFLPKKGDHTLTPMYESFDVVVDQSNKPQVFIIRPHLDARDRGRRLIQKLPFGQKLLEALGKRNRNLGKKAA